MIHWNKHATIQFSPVSFGLLFILHPHCVYSSANRSQMMPLFWLSSSEAVFPLPIVLMVSLWLWTREKKLIPHYFGGSQRLGYFCQPASRWPKISSFATTMFILSAGREVTCKPREIPDQW
ncbi:hypothetical protein LZ32DRAFT_189701 [Colletotrichum eremochloae]|nr:hypothetical protein LZ32DRAFT_189701 [Colletotrichum eremochloae]